MFKLWVLPVFLFITASCAYQIGYSGRSLPGGYEQLAIPVFSNKTMEVGIESFFTNALIREFESSRVARVASKEVAPIYIVGEISNYNLEANSQVAATDKNKDLKYLPQNSVIDTTYRMTITAKLRLVRASDQKTLWSSSFSSERVYSSPQISMAVINSANATYNNSAKQQNFDVLAREMMEDAHDRITEMF